jgi:hypothetical protein
VIRGFLRRNQHLQRGQGLVEFAIALPIVAVLLVSIVEVGLIYGAMQSIGYASREAARVGAALAQGGNCTTPPPTPLLPDVDAVAVGAAQRVMKSPDSGIDLSRIQEIRIFKSTSDGGEQPGLVNVWTYAGPRAGPDVDPGVGGGNVERIDFRGPLTPPWAACSRINELTSADSIGVTVRYRYDFVTPFAAVLGPLVGGNPSVDLSQTTVMALNPDF